MQKGVEKAMKKEGQQDDPQIELRRGVHAASALAMTATVATAHVMARVAHRPDIASDA